MYVLKAHWPSFLRVSLNLGLARLPRLAPSELGGLSCVYLPQLRALGLQMNLIVSALWSSNSGLYALVTSSLFTEPPTWPIALLILFGQHRFPLVKQEAPLKGW